MKAIRSPRAADVLEQEAIGFDVRALDGHRHVLLVTRRRDGSRIATPMWFAADGKARLVVRSGATDPKVARVRRDGTVEVAACDPRGRPLGTPMQARARILDRDEETAAELLLRRALGRRRDLYSLVRAPLLAMTYIEVVADGRLG